jgi:hypothetical protein
MEGHPSQWKSSTAKGPIPWDYQSKMDRWDKGGGIQNEIVVYGGGRQKKRRNWMSSPDKAIGQNGNIHSFNCQQKFSHCSSNFCTNNNMLFYFIFNRR